MKSPTIFEKILDGSVPSKKIYENEHCLSFHDISPAAPLHALVIPKKKIENVHASQPEDVLQLGELILAAKETANLLGLAENGYRLVMNIGSDGGQTVDYLHCHVLGGRPLKWPPG
jgi:histidine triad (HIT) family protein